MTGQQQTEFLEALQNPAIYDHPAHSIELIETHISWVVLTGPYAYKIKKPVNLGFADFSTLEKRHHFCLEELRLNRRLAPSLYQEVVSFCGTPRKPELNGTGPPFEYAVKMVQFPPEARLDHLLPRQRLRPSHIDQLARDVAEFHSRITVAAPDSPWGKPEEIHIHARDNFTILLQLVEDNEKKARIEQVAKWSDTCYRHLRESMLERRRKGYIRECHGDMHLANMVLLHDRVTIFDCIEFNPSLRWIDIVNELAFVVMDLEYRGRADLAFRFLNRQLEYSGDYTGLLLLDYYRVYRAMVRAKVAGIRISQCDTPSHCATASETELRSYLSLAERYSGRNRNRPRLYITHGFSGSGKTWHTQPFLERLGAIRIRSDIERKRLFGLTPEGRSDSRLNKGIYTPQTSRRVYQRLEELANTILSAGFSVIVDATFLKRRQREPFRRLAEQRQLPFTILDFHADIPTLRARIDARSREGRDASEATLKVLDQQLASAEPLDTAELSCSIHIDAWRSSIPLPAGIGNDRWEPSGQES